MRTLLLIAVLAACGGNKQADTTPMSNSSDDRPVAQDQSGEMLSPEKMEEVQHDLDRKNMIVSRCLASAVEAGEAKKTAKGKVALEIVIDDGKATSVKVIKSDFEAKSINDCVVGHVQTIEFPQMKHRYETSHTYAMEAN